MYKRPRIGQIAVIAVMGLSAMFTWRNNAHSAVIVGTETFSDETVVIAIKSLPGLGIAHVTRASPMSVTLGMKMTF